ncbi:HNH endonuclease [Sphingobacterium anhuiense]|uniref:HNH endonuclease n=1 Tax=Sphingobacterium anhuiense TaxID=493780 RepID=UPI003C2C1547
MKIIKIKNGISVIVDDEDFDYLSQFKWFAKRDSNTYYVARNFIRSDGKKTTMRMHREITKAPRNFQVDHIDRNGLNNQRSNLRLVTNAQNAQNTRAKRTSKSGVKGVSWDRTRKKWSVTICLNRKNIRIGRFNEFSDAVEARKEANKLYHPFNTENHGVIAEIY